MSRTTKAATTLSAVGTCLLGALSGEAQEATITQQSPELKVLQRFVGSWQQQVLINTAEWISERLTMTATVTADWILSGRMVENKGVYSPGGMRFLVIVAYDAENKEYRQWCFDSHGTIPRGDESRGKWDETTQTFTWLSSTSDGGTQTQTHRFIDKDAFEWTLVRKDRNGKVYLDIEAKSKRK